MDETSVAHGIVLACKKRTWRLGKTEKKPKEKVKGMALVWISEYKINKKVLREQVSIAICIQGRYRGAGRCKMLGGLMPFFVQYLPLILKYWGC